MNSKKNEKPVQSSKGFNITRVIEYMRTHEFVTVFEISADTYIPIPTVYRVMQYLLKLSIIIMTKKHKSKSGRRAGIYSINYDFKHVMGIFLDKRILNVFIANMNGKTLNKWTHKYDKEYDQNEILSIIDNGIKSVLLDCREKSNLDQIPVIGFAVTAAIEGSDTIKTFTNMRCLDDFNIVNYMEKKYDKKTILMKNAYLEAYSYINQYSKQGIYNFVFVHIGVGIGAAIVINGKLYEGSFGNAGELVRVLVEKEGKQHTLESAYSTQQTYDRFLSYIKKSQSSELGEIVSRQEDLYPDDLDRAMMKSIEVALVAGDECVADMILNDVKGWAKIVRDVIAFYDPATLIIGGDITEDTPNIFNMIKNTVLETMSTNTQIVSANKDQTMDMAVVLNVSDYVYNEIYLEALGDNASLINYFSDNKSERNGV